MGYFFNFLAVQEGGIREYQQEVKYVNISNQFFH